MSALELRAGGRFGDVDAGFDRLRPADRPHAVAARAGPATAAATVQRRPASSRGAAGGDFDAAGVDAHAGPQPQRARQHAGELRQVDAGGERGVARGQVLGRQAGELREVELAAWLRPRASRCAAVSCSAASRAAGERGVDGERGGGELDEVAGERVGGEAHVGGVELAGGGDRRHESRRWHRRIGGGRGGTRRGGPAMPSPAFCHVSFRSAEVVPRMRAPGRTRASQGSSGASGRRSARRSSCWPPASAGVELEFEAAGGGGRAGCGDARGVEAPLADGGESASVRTPVPVASQAPVGVAGRAVASSWSMRQLLAGGGVAAEDRAFDDFDLGERRRRRVGRAAFGRRLARPLRRAARRGLRGCCRRRAFRDARPGAMTTILPRWRRLAASATSERSIVSRLDRARAACPAASTSVTPGERLAAGPGEAGVGGGELRRRRAARRSTAAGCAAASWR